MATKINIRTLLEAGCHFGHQTRRWNPKMKPFIFGERNGIYILDLKQTILDADQAYTFVKNVAKGGNVLFVGTKKQAQEAVKNAAERANMPYINQRWLGGMLTNFVTIRSRINRMEELEAMVEDGRMAVLPKKEQAVLGKELTKLQTNLGGARDMKGLPQALFVIDTKREENAIKEAAVVVPLAHTSTPSTTPLSAWASPRPSAATWRASARSTTPSSSTTTCRTQRLRWASSTPASRRPCTTRSGNRSSTRSL